MRVKWSQNFLIDKNCAKKAISVLEVSNKDFVLEIGPGKGILTEELLAQATKVLAVEIDPNLCKVLKERFKTRSNFFLLGKDFLEFDERDLEVFENRPFKVIGNLPYAIVSKAIQTILSLPNWVSAVVMVQKEVAQRICAGAGSKEYGILSLSVQAQSFVKKVSGVSRFSFRPIPKVESALIKLTPRREPLLTKKEEGPFFKVVRAAFQQRRKKIINSISHGLKIPVNNVKEVLDKSSLNSSSRAEELTLEDFLRLSKVLFQ